MHKLIVGLGVSALLATGLTAAPAEAAPRHYRSCAAMQRDFPHGVGLVGARDRTSGVRVTTFRRNNRLYRANNGPRNLTTGEYDLDRDNDGIACEKR